MKMKTLLRNEALEDLVLLATDCAGLARSLRDNADRQSISVDQLHNDARKLEALCQALRTDVCKIERDLPTDHDAIHLSVVR